MLSLPNVFYNHWAQFHSRYDTTGAVEVVELIIYVVVTRAFEK